MSGWEAMSHESSGFCFCGDTHAVESADRPDWVLESRYKVDAGLVEHWYNDRDRQEVKRLRTVIESAPHWVSEHDADDCCGWYSDDNYCNCWKRDAL